LNITLKNDFVREMEERYEKLNAESSTNNILQQHEANSLINIPIYHNKTKKYSEKFEFEYTTAINKIFKEKFPGYVNYNDFELLIELCNNLYVNDEILKFIEMLQKDRRFETIMENKMGNIFRLRFAIEKFVIAEVNVELKNYFDVISTNYITLL
jgi:hypothetical protein